MKTTNETFTANHIKRYRFIQNLYNEETLSQMDQPTRLAMRKWINAYRPTLEELANNGFGNNENEALVFFNGINDAIKNDVEPGANMFTLKGREMDFIRLSNEFDSEYPPKTKSFSVDTPEERAAALERTRRQQEERNQTEAKRKTDEETRKSEEAATKAEKERIIAENRLKAIEDLENKGSVTSSNATDFRANLRSAANTTAPIEAAPAPVPAPKTSPKSDRSSPSSDSSNSSPREAVPVATQSDKTNLVSEVTELILNVTAPTGVLRALKVRKVTPKNVETFIAILKKDNPDITDQAIKEYVRNNQKGINAAFTVIEGWRTNAQTKHMKVALTDKSISTIIANESPVAAPSPVPPTHESPVAAPPVNPETLSVKEKIALWGSNPTTAQHIPSSKPPVQGKGRE